jgi:transposase-like protein
VRALLHSVYDQPDAASVRAQFSRVLGALEEKLPQVAAHLDAAQADILAFTAFPKAIWRSGATTRIESLNYQLWKVTKARGHLPGGDAVVKLLWLAIINIEDKQARERAARQQENR